MYFSVHEEKCGTAQHRFFELLVQLPGRPPPLAVAPVVVTMQESGSASAASRSSGPSSSKRETTRLHIAMATGSTKEASGGFIRVGPKQTAKFSSFILLTPALAYVGNIQDHRQGSLSAIAHAMHNWKDSTVQQYHMSHARETHGNVAKQLSECVARAQKGTAQYPNPTHSQVEKLAPGK
jgi:hypothetical protein